MVTAAGDAFLQRQHEAQDDTGDVDEQVTDSKRNWSPDVLLELAHIWRRVELAHTELGRVAKAQLVYDEFSKRVDHGGAANNDGGGGAAKRSRKAVEDKLYTMKQMYRFIIEMNRDFVRQRVGSRNSFVRSWFDLTKQERRAVRSLHGIRIPNISQEVFHVLDSVLHAGTMAAAKGKKNKVTHGAQQLQYVPSLSRVPSVLDTNSSYGVDADGPQQDLMPDGKRNWSADETKKLARTWSDIQSVSPSLRGSQLGEMVYNEFKASAGESLSRSRKAVGEKMQSMNEMYRFIKRYEDTRRGPRVGDGDGGGDGSPMRLAWFELTKAERRQFRKMHKIRATNLSQNEFDQVDAIMRLRAEADTVAVDLAAPPLTLEPTSVAPQAYQQSTEQQPVQTTETDQSTTGVPGVVQRIIAQGLRADNPVERDSHSRPTDNSAATGAAARARAQKRPRSEEQPPSPQNGAVSTIDHATAAYLLEKIRHLHEEDREERRRQHAEHMAAIKELAELMRNQQSSTMAREEEAAS